MSNVSRLGYAVAAAALLGFTPVVRAQNAAPASEIESLRQEVQAIKKGQDDIKTQLEDIKKLLAARNTPSPKEAVRDINIPINLEGQPSRGSADAKIILVEYSEYQCPFCARHTTQTNPQIEKNYVETGKIRHVFKDFPLEFHKSAPKAAEATMCAEDQGKYWEMHEMLFNNQKALAIDDLKKYATDLGLDVAKFEQCLNGGAKAEQIKADMEEARKAGISGTPAFILAIVDPQNPKMAKGVKVMSGARPYDFFKEEIDKMLGGAK
jgi:protein-disulfide isomerase